MSAKKNTGISEPPDPTAALLAMIERHNQLEAERHQLEVAIMQALLKRKGCRVRYATGGQLMHQLYHADWERQHRPNVLIVENLGIPAE